MSALLDGLQEAMGIVAPILSLLALGGLSVAFAFFVDLLKKPRRRNTYQPPKDH